MAVTATGGFGSPDCQKVAFNGDNLLKLDNVEDDSTVPATALTGATVTANIFESDGTTLIQGPIAMAEFPSAPSNDYRGTFFASTGNGYSVNQRIEIVYTVDAGVGLRRDFYVIAIVCQ